MVMEKKKRTLRETIEWLKAAQKRQQDWQKEVKQRWSERQKATIVTA